MNNHIDKDDTIPTPIVFKGVEIPAPSPDKTQRLRMVTPYSPQNFLAWYQHIMSTPDDMISNTAKNVVVAMMLEIDESRKYDDRMWNEHFRVYDSQIARRLGCDKRTVLRARKQVQHCFNVVQSVEYVEMIPYKTNWYLPSPALLNGVIEEDNRNDRRNGQKHYACLGCGSDNVLHYLTHTYKCIECGYVHEIRKLERKREI